MENFSLNRCHLNLVCTKFSKRCTCCNLPKMNECIVLSKYRYLIPHEVFFKSISGTKKLGLHRRRKKTGREWRNVRGERELPLTSRVSPAPRSFWGPYYSHEPATLATKNAPWKQANILRLLYLSSVYVEVNFPFRSIIVFPLFWGILLMNYFLKQKLKGKPRANFSLLIKWGKPMEAGEAKPRDARNAVSLRFSSGWLPLDGLRKKRETACIGSLIKRKKN